MGCAQHHCRMKKENAAMTSSKTQTTETRILVAKPDGSQQCQENSGISLEKMAKDLGSLKVHRQFKQNDGLMRIQVCGAPTGMYNVYEIDQTDLTAAQNVGFKVWKGPEGK